GPGGARRAAARGRLRAGAAPQPLRRHRRAPFRLAALRAALFSLPRLRGRAGVGGLPSLHRRIKRSPHPDPPPQPREGIGWRVLALVPAGPNLARLTQIALPLAEPGALFPLDLVGAAAPAIRLLRLVRSPAPGMAGLRPGQRLARALEQLGPSFIKFGQ